MDERTIVQKFGDVRAWQICSSIEKAVNALIKAGKLSKHSSHDRITSADIDNFTAAIQFLKKNQSLYESEAKFMLAHMDKRTVRAITNIIDVEDWLTSVWLE